MTVNLQDVNFLDPEHHVGVEVQVGKHTVTMYPVSPLHVPRFQKILKTALPAMRDLFYRYTDENGQRSQEEVFPDGRTIKEVVLLPSEPGLTTTHKKFRDQSIREAVDALTSEEGMQQLAVCILDSARDEFEREPGKPFNKADGLALLEKLTTPQLLALSVGLVRANLQSFPLGQKAAAKAVAKMEAEIDRFDQDESGASASPSGKEDPDASKA